MKLTVPASPISATYATNYRTAALQPDPLSTRSQARHHEGFNDRTRFYVHTGPTSL
jgi:hypothetical protein